MGDTKLDINAGDAELENIRMKEMTTAENVCQADITTKSSNLFAIFVQRAARLVLMVRVIAMSANEGGTQTRQVSHNAFYALWVEWLRQTPVRNARGVSQGVTAFGMGAGASSVHLAGTNIVEAHPFASQLGAVLKLRIRA